ncbi:hypothetical protein GGR88_001084 [Sphingomonas jejuensis]|uniref:Periplasmic heavy metal sensor n=1 Tax=Sphingomonas jejuensis TaxID=904715 RepID=A0ABX0XK48_9SPHN|nr:hypothetical protein [Sphingomonas jejuensis]NJC33610.1 hypothetical protein [Sphingomonas jejuensis]
MSMIMWMILAQAALQVQAPAAPGLDQLSVGGRAVLQQSMADNEVQARGFAERSAAASEMIEAAAVRRPFDLQALRAALETRDAVDVDRLRARTARGIELLSRLSEADREIVLRVIPGLTGIRGPAGEAPTR